MWKKVSGMLSAGGLSRERLVEQTEVMETANTSMEQTVSDQRQSLRISQQMVYEQGQSIKGYQQRIKELKRKPHDQEQLIEDQRGTIEAMQKATSRMEKEKKTLQTQVQN